MNWTRSQMRFFGNFLKNKKQKPYRSLPIRQAITKIKDFTCGYI